MLVEVLDMLVVKSLDMLVAWMTRICRVFAAFSSMYHARHVLKRISRRILDVLVVHMTRIETY